MCKAVVEKPSAENASIAKSITKATSRGKRSPTTREPVANKARVPKASRPFTHISLNRKPRPHDGTTVE
jgi:hypothetical protein